MQGFRAGMPRWRKAGDTRRSVTSSFATAVTAATPPSARPASSSRRSTVVASICRPMYGPGSTTSAGGAGRDWPVRRTTISAPRALPCCGRSKSVSSCTAGRSTQSSRPTCRAVARRPEARRPMARRAGVQPRPPARDRPSDDGVPAQLRPPPGCASPFGSSTRAAGLEVGPVCRLARCQMVHSKGRSRGKTSGMGQRSGRPVLKICDDDLFFTVDVPVLRIRRSTSAEAARREQRWARCSARKLRLRSELTVRIPPETEPLVPWRELAASWQQVLSTFDGLFEND